MRLAAYVGNSDPILEFAASKTHREYRTWMRHLEEELNQPSRSDFYLMQIAAEARYAFRERPASLALNKFRIPFKTRGHHAEPDKRSIEEITAHSKAAWKLRTRMIRPKKKSSRYKRQEK